MADLITVDRATKVFDRSGRRVVAVDDVSLSVAAGEIVGIVGESGSGKSTLASLLLGLTRLDQGVITVGGRSLAEWLGSRASQREFRRMVQPIFQYPVAALDSRMTVARLIAEPWMIHEGVSAKHALDRVQALMETVQLDPVLARHHPDELSGGQAQRVNIARALALEPRILVCDEPTSALDVSVQAHILNLLMEIQEQRDMTVLFISHSVPVVRHVSDRVVVMYAGRVVEVSDAATLTREPVHPYSKLLVGAAEGGYLARARTDGDSQMGNACRFAPRCLVAVERCHEEEPVLEGFGENLQVRCWRAKEILDGSLSIEAEVTL